MADGTTTTNFKVRFFEVSDISKINQLATGDIGFIPGSNAIYHNGKYYGFTDAERNIIDHNNGTLWQEVNDRIKTISVNSSTSTDIMTITNAGTASPTLVNLHLSGTTLPISTANGSTIKQYIDATVNAAKQAAEASGVTSLTVNGLVTPLNGSTGPVTVNVSGTNALLGTTLTSTTTYATPLNAASSIASSIEKLDKEILGRYTTLDGKISTNSSSITTLKGIKHYINSGTTASLSTTNQEFVNDTSKTINLNSTNIVVGGASLSGSAITTTNSNESIHKALENLYSRLDTISDVSSTTVTTLNELAKELNSGNGSGFASSFLDKIGALIGGFNVSVADATPVTGATTALHNAVATMITNAIGTAPYITSIAFTSNTNTAGQLGTTITANSSTHTGTVNITGNKVVVGSNVTTAHATTAIASTDSIATALGKLQKEINSVSTNAQSGIASAPYFTTINITSNTNTSDLTETADANNHTATLNVKAKDLILGEQSTAGATLLATTDSIVAALNKLNKQTKTELDKKLENIIVNTVTGTKNGATTSVTINGTHINVGTAITSGAVNINSGSTVAQALKLLDDSLKTTNTNVYNATSDIKTATTNIYNATTDIYNATSQLVWYTI